MLNFTNAEKQILELVRNGYSKSHILRELGIKIYSLQNYLSNIFTKTEPYVHYHSSRKKFEELGCFLRNNPTVFTDMIITDTPEEEIRTNLTDVKEDKSVNADVKAAPDERTKEILEKLYIELDKIRSSIMNDAQKVEAKLEVINAVYNVIYNI